MRHPNPSVLTERARAMRFAPTFSEAILWQALMGSRLGVAFRRQLPIGRYIADFCAPSRRLIVEVDGGYHSRQVKADARRDRRLAQLGYRVVRVSDELVVHDLGAALAKIREALADSDE